MRTTIAFLLLTLFTSSAFADCLVSFARPKSRAMSETFVNDATFSRIIKILENKGYEVVEPEALNGRSADNALDVAGYWGIGCGTGMTFKDYLKVPAYFSVEFSVAQGNVVFDKKDSFDRTVMLGIKAKARNRLLNAIKEIPACNQ